MKKNKEMEIWKEITGFEGFYCISNKGRVKSLKCIRKLSYDKDKYLSVRLKRKKIGKTCKVHRLVAIHFIPNPDNLPEVNHLDFDKTNNNDWNLEWTTNKLNIEHARLAKRAVGKVNRFGDKNGMSKLTQEKANNIRKLWKEGIKRKELAVLFKVSESSIQRVIYNKNWKN